MARLQLALLLLLVSVTLLMSPASGFKGMLGARMAVSDLKRNKEVQELGRFSVEELNRQLRHHGNGGEELVFSEVIEAEKQVVSGFKYYMKIEAANENGEAKVFNSVVVVKPWIHSRQLVKFEAASAIELNIFRIWRGCRLIF